MVKGSIPDRSNHSRSKPGSDLGIEDMIEESISITMDRIVQRSGVSHANWRRLRHTDPSFKGAAHTAWSGLCIASG